MKLYHKESKFRVLISLLMLLIIIVAMASAIGSANIKVLDVYRVILSKMPIINKYINVENITDAQFAIIWNVRLPRVILGMMVGASLSVAGVSFQGLLKNPMADPYILGVSSGAALGATIAIISKFEYVKYGFSSITLAAFIGAIVAVFIVYNIGKINNKLSTNTLLLAGVAVGQFFTAIMSFLMVFNSNDMSRIIYWTMGSLSGKGWNPVKTLSIPILLTIVVLIYYSKELNILLTGDETAKSMGVNVERTKQIILVLGTLLTSLVVSVSGIIGFVGLIIPHITRIIFGPDHRILIPSSAMVGAIFMIVTDTISRTLISPVEIPVGIITAMFGGPFFIYLLRSKKKMM
ncbi:iron ABC transporter permease [Soehngenia longivitae]|uniref:Iron ABC transporter permease n=1 Tax=Soehngenia longivitae TaxID=2562294 RepID=A0A4Z0D670_9FIRM|nr:iron chelate uptake ABC transporter family permease subunit [Soehngenia longivitae]TFZ40375.1 iron ABC transporter permease [Soehngenia longivitae]